MKKYVVVGGVAGGASVAARLRRLDEKAEIILFEKGEYVSYANCGLPYYLGGVIEERDRLFVQTPDSFKARFRIEVRIRHEVKMIDPEKKLLLVRELSTGREYYESFDKLVLSPGAEPVRPPLEGIGCAGIFTLRNVADTDRIKNWMERHEVRQAVVVGAGFIGLEMAENLKQAGIDVTVVEMAEQVMTPVDFEIAAVVHEHFKVKGIGLLLNEVVEAFKETINGLEIRLRSGKLLSADLVILSIGVRPDVRLARDSGLEIGETGGIWVNEYLQTSHPDIYAVGDAVEFIHPVSKRPSLTFLAGPANKQGRICADNLAEGNYRVYRGAIGTAIAKIFDLTVGCTGLSSRVLERYGIPFREVIVHVASHAGYYPGAIPMTIKILFSPDGGKLLGAQVVGYEGADKRLEMMAVVLKSGGTVYDLMEVEQAYAPPFSSAKDPVNMAGFVADNILSGKVAPVSWRELQKKRNEPLTLVNVCSGEECALHSLEGAMNIPLHEVRERMKEIPVNIPVIVFCAVGLRGYIASRILAQNGYEVYNLTGGLKTYECVTADQNNFLDFRKPENHKDSGMSPKEENPCLTVDACGLQCPGPVMKLKSSMERLQVGQRLVVTATDAGFAKDVQSWAKMTGNRVLEITQEKGKIAAVLEKGGQKPETLSATQGNGKTIVVFSDDLDKALAAFVIANGAASTGRKVTLFFTFWGLNVIKSKTPQKVKKDIIGRMFGFMLPSGSHKLKLSKLNMGGIGPKMMRKVMQKKKIESLENLIGQAQNSGVEFIACQMSMEVMGVKPEELLEGVQIGGVATYLERTEEADMNLFI